MNCSIWDSLAAKNIGMPVKLQKINFSCEFKKLNSTKVYFYYQLWKKFIIMLIANKNNEIGKFFKR